MQWTEVGPTDLPPGLLISSAMWRWSRCSARSLETAGIRGCPDGIAILQTARRGKRLQSECASTKREKKVRVKISFLFPILPGLAHRCVYGWFPLTAECCPSTVHFCLRHCPRGDQSSDAGFTQTVTVAAHAILQSSALKSPLAAEPAIIFCTFSLPRLCHAGGAQNSQDNDKRS